MFDFSESEAPLPSFPPPPQAAPDFFNEEVETLGLDGLNFDDDLPQISTLLDGSFTTPSLASPSDSAYTTDSSEDPATSEYSSLAYSNYASSFDIALRDVDLGFEYKDVNPEHNFMFSDPFALFDSFGSPQHSPAPFPYVYVAEAQSDDGPYRPSVGISPQSLFIASPSPSPAFPTDFPVCAASMEQQARKLPDPDSGSTRIRTGPIRTRFICPQCGHPSARKHNLKTHMETHNPNRKKPFVCPEYGCGQAFVRKHDRKRHLESMHGDQAD